MVLTDPFLALVYCSMGCNYFVVTHESGKGLIATHGRGRISNEKKSMALNIPNFQEQEILSLRKSLSVEDGSKVLLLVSLCTDAMIKLVAMHPEVWFMDVTSAVNRQKTDLFMLAIRTPSGETFPGNFTFIPSGKRWVFQCIYQYAFIALFGKTTCSRNRLAMFDDDIAEHGPFQSCINSIPEFKNSRVMLCVFHAVWMPFRDILMRIITARFCDTSGNLTVIGKKVGEFHLLMK